MSVASLIPRVMGSTPTPMYASKITQPHTNTAADAVLTLPLHATETTLPQNPNKRQRKQHYLAFSNLPTSFSLRFCANLSLFLYPYILGTSLTVIPGASSPACPGSVNSSKSTPGSVPTALRYSKGSSYPSKTYAKSPVLPSDADAWSST